jgi:lipid-binding SYLF domain-containing protein
MKKLLLLTLIVSLSSISFAANAIANDQPRESKASDRTQAAADVLNEIQGAPDSGIPQEVLGSAQCVAVVPSMLKGGFIVAAKYGRGLASCRTPKAARPWI